VKVDTPGYLSKNGRRGLWNIRVKVVSGWGHGGRGDKAGCFDGLVN